MDKNKSFTFIELIVVIGVMLILSGMSLAYFSNYNSDSKLNSEMSKLEDVLSLVQNKAMAGDEGSSNCTGFIGYTVTIPDPNTYSYSISCNSCNSGCSPHSFALPPGYTITSSSNSFTYKSLKGEIPAITTITITSNTNKCKQISIAQNGLVNEVATCP